MSVQTELKELVLRLIPLQPYPCGFCVKVFYTENNRQSHHNSAHAKEQKTTCTICKQICRSEHGLRIHMFHHTEATVERPFKCKKCGKGFRANRNMRAHFLDRCSLKTTDKSIICKFCPIAFSTVLERKTHLDTAHAKEQKQLTCTICSKVLVNFSGLAVHLLSHSTEIPFVCKTCGKGFKLAFRLKQHTARHTKKPNFECKICGQTFHQVRQFQSHQKAFLGKCVGIDRETATCFPCSVCGKKFPAQKRLSQHVRYNHLDENTYECGVCGRKEHAPSSLRIHQASHQPNRPKPFACNLCEKAYGVKSQLRDHVQTAHTSGPKRFPCQLCSYTTQFSHDLKKHMRIHEGIRPFVCATCGKAWANLSNLMSHVRSHQKEAKEKGVRSDVRYNHLDEKKYECGVRGRKEQSPASLRAHEASHQPNSPKSFARNLCEKAYGVNSQRKDHVQAVHTNGPKRFPCHLCSYTTQFSCNLKKQIRIHEGIRPFVCSNCGKAFSSKYNLQSHARSHQKEAFGCSVCGLMYVRKSTLKVHEATHTGTWDYLCQHCPEKFIQASTLKRHERTHSDVGCFKCDICSCGFVKKAMLARHIRRNHTVLGL